MKKIFREFKKFISRGSVMDMAVGTIIGAAFTAMVTALSNGILKPLINTVIYYICGGNSDALNKMYTPLVPQYIINEAGEKILDLTTSIYIDWGAFISAIINFLLVAFVLFLVIKTFNEIKEADSRMKNVLSRAQYKEKKGRKLSKKEAKALEEFKKQQEEAKKKELEEASKPVEPTFEEKQLALLTQISEKLDKLN